MHPLEKEIAASIRRQGLLQAGERVVVGVSAGSDSMALLHLLAVLAPGFQVELVAVYVDHGLRPAETGREAALVRATAARLGLAAEVGVVDVSALAAREKLSVEDAARQARYGFLRGVAQRYGGAKIAVAHTADDQAEEVLLRLLRGCGRKGLAGMAPLRAGGVIRPFLTIAKGRLLDYLADRGLDYLEDSSNQQRQYLRNRIRLDLLPYLEREFNAGVRQTLRQTAAILQEEEELLEGLAAAAAARCVRRPAPLRVEIELASLLALPLAIQRRVVEKVFWQLAQPPAFRLIAQVLRLAATGKEGGRLHGRGGLRVWRQGRELLFFYPQGRVSQRGDLTTPEDLAYETTIPGPGSYSCSPLGVQVELVEVARAEVEALGFVSGVQYLAAERLHFPLRLRTIRPGDRFHPLGGPGQKKVADFLSDLKLPRANRRRQLVLVAGEEIAVLPGLRVAEGFKITAASRRILRVTLQARRIGEGAGEQG